MRQWINEFKSSLKDKTFTCSIFVYIVTYSLIIAIGLLLPLKIFIGLLGAIAGWQVASWSKLIAPKFKQFLFKE
jgi:hypothetical protein